jgi:hypothetical protein
VSEVEELRGERARLWEQLHDQRALEQEVEFLRAKVARMETSLSWRITKPIRLFKQRYDRFRKPD